jgi:hypothetical protein
MVLLALLSLPALAPAQQIYVCKDAKGRNTYQQTPCAGASRPTGTHAYPAPPASAPAPRAAPGVPYRGVPTPKARSAAIAVPSSGGALIQADRGPTGAAGPFVRCIGADGSMRTRQGTTCPSRLLPRQAGMVTDMSTGQQRFMVPGGGNGMIDPTTGQRHELITPQQRVQDRAEQVSGQEACAEATAKYQSVMSDFNRSINQMRAAEDRKRRFCGG